VIYHFPAQSRKTTLECGYRERPSLSEMTTVVWFVAGSAADQILVWQGRLRIQKRHLKKCRRCQVGRDPPPPSHTHTHTAPHCCAPFSAANACSAYGTGRILHPLRLQLDVGMRIYPHRAQRETGRRGKGEGVVAHNFST
jgi:hypothetical protein